MEEKMNKKILENRDRIDKADNQIFDLLLERLDAVNTIGYIKKQEGLPVLDQERENAIYAKIDVRFSTVEASFLKPIYESIITESKKVEEL
jgi:chorismate mutase